MEDRGFRPENLANALGTVYRKTGFRTKSAIVQIVLPRLCVIEGEYSVSFKGKCEYRTYVFPRGQMAVL